MPDREVTERPWWVRAIVLNAQDAAAADTARSTAAILGTVSVLAGLAAACSLMADLNSTDARVSLHTLVAVAAFALPAVTALWHWQAARWLKARKS
jgi:hypothetical protein